MLAWPCRWSYPNPPKRGGIIRRERESAQRFYSVCFARDKYGAILHGYCKCAHQNHRSSSVSLAPSATRRLHDVGVPVKVLQRCIPQKAYFPGFSGLLGQQPPAQTLPILPRWTRVACRVRRPAWHKAWQGSRS